MKRGKKLIRNLCLIVILLFAYCYFGGYYLSKEACIEDSLRGLQRNEREIVTEFTLDNIDYAVVMDREEKVYSVSGTKRIGFLYHTIGGVTGHVIQEEDCIDLSGYGDPEGAFLIIYRNDKKVQRIEAELLNGREIVFDEWEDDFSIAAINDKEWYRGTYKAYDANGELIGEVQY